MTRDAQPSDSRAARRRRYWPLAVVALAIAWQYRAPLVGRVWCFEDIANYFMPLYAAAARAMRAGGFPTWALGAWSGQPLVGDPQLGLFYPPNWLWLALKPVTLYAWLMLLHALLAAGGMYAWARARGRSIAASSLAAVTISVGAFFVLELRHAMFIATTAWVPWIGWALERYAQRRRLDHFLWIAIAGGMALLAGGWSMLAYGGGVLVIIAGARLHHENRAARGRLVVMLAAAGALALALAAASLLPALAHARQSPRALGVTYELASSYAWPSWRYALTLIFPTLYGDDARGTYAGAPDQWELCGYGIGAVGTVLAICSLVERERRGERLLLFALTLAACDVARGSGGILHPLLYRMPLFGSLRCPARALYVWTIAAPILAADGADALVVRLHNFVMRSHIKIVQVHHEKIAAAVAALLLLGAAGELLVTFRSENPSTTRQVAEHVPQAVEWLRANGRPGRMTNDVHLPQRFHNIGLEAGIESAGGYHSLPIWRYLHLLWIANHGAVYPRARLGDDLTAQGLWRFGSPIVDLLGVEWVLTARDRPVAARGFVRAFSGDDGLDVYKNLGVFPRAFVVFRAHRVDGEAAAARAVAEPGWRPSRVAILESGGDDNSGNGNGDDASRAIPEPTAGLDDPPPESVREYARLGPTTLELTVDVRQPGILVVAEPWYPGWSAVVDGEPAAILRADYALRGVFVSPGRHTIMMTLRCLPLEIGAAISIAALLLIAVLAGADARRRRRTPATGNDAAAGARA